MKRSMTDLERRAALAMERYAQYTNTPWKIRECVKAARDDEMINDAIVKYLWLAVWHHRKRIKDPELQRKSEAELAKLDTEAGEFGPKLPQKSL